jgi:hypothetical protein
MNRFFLLCPLVLVLASCSAEVYVETPPLDPVAIPVTSFFQDVYVEVAIDMPPETQGDITVLDVGADLVVVNPSRGLTLSAEAVVSTQGEATPDLPRVTLTPPPYYSQASVLLARQSFAPNSRTPMTITSPGLANAVGSKRIWIIVSNTVSRTSIGDALPLELRLEDIVLKATVTKPFDGLGGALPVGGL